MRIAYVAHLNDGRASGVVAKITAQLHHWRLAGHVVTIFVATKDVDRSWTSELGDVSVHTYDGPISRFRALASLISEVRRFGPSVIYVRWDLFYPSMIWLPRTARLVAEVNTDDLAEDVFGSRRRALYNRLTRGLWLRRSAGLVFVTSELSRLASFRRTKATKVVVTNGVDLTVYPHLPGPKAGPVRLAFVGTGDVTWHGVDKVVRLAAMRPGWLVDMVGIPQPNGPLPPNVTWHPPLDRPRLLDILGQADVGIGTLALHRKGLDEGSPLKVREYLAVGLPVLYGYHDPDADPMGPFVLRIANTETNVEDEIDRIDSFVLGARGLRVPRSAVAHLDVSIKEEQRLALFEALAGR